MTYFMKVVGGRALGFGRFDDGDIKKKFYNEECVDIVLL